jgi:predicted N-formylglutamate amidohydrolase
LSIDAKAPQRAEFTPLLGANDPPAVVVENAGARTPYLLVCDHAGRTIPQSLDSLGLPSEEYERHVAWDIGAGDLSSQLGRRLGAWTIKQTYSRLVVDCNRAPDHPGLIVETADGSRVPGNLDLTPADVRARLDAIHTPYHAAIAAELDRRAAEGLPAVLVSIHSFTPVFQGFVRPWHMGVLHDGASEASRRALEALRAEPGLVVGDNEPYAMDGIDYTIPLHAIARGLDYVELETRQDLIADAEGVRRFTDLLERALPRLFAD